VLETFAIVCAGLFSGAAVYISLVQQPAALEAGVPMAVAFFPPMYRRAARMQGGLAALGTLAGARWPWLVGAVALASAALFTVLVIKRTNDRLLAPDLDPTSPGAAELLQRWGRLHALRSAAGGLAFLAFLLGRAIADGGPAG